jgi:POT family proton-dependent oligopeptide transporter
MTKELFPSLVVAVEAGKEPLPWSLYSLIVLPAAFLTAMAMARRAPQSGAPLGLLGVASVVVLAFLLLDVLAKPQTAGSLTFLGAFFVVALTAPFAWLWPKLDRINMNPSAPAKFGWGLVFAGISMGILMYAAKQSDGVQLVSVWWLVLAYFVLELGEMVLSPIGLSVVTQLSVPRVMGLMMGAWFLFSAFGEIIAGRLGTLAAMDPNTPLPQALTIFGDTFGTMMWIGLGSGVAMLAITPLLKRLMRA